MARHSKKNRKSLARQTMAGRSLKRRIKVVEEKLLQKKGGGTATVMGGLLLGIQAASDLIQIWDNLDEGLKAVIRGTLNNIPFRFMARIDNMPADEQVVQAGELILVLRTMDKVLGSTPAPVVNNYLTEIIVQEDLEDAVLDALSMHEQQRSAYFKVLREKWELHSTPPQRPGVLPDDLAA